MSVPREHQRALLLRLARQAMIERDLGGRACARARHHAHRRRRTMSVPREHERALLLRLARQAMIERDLDQLPVSD